MPRKRLVVVNITLQGPEWDFDEKVTFAGRDFRRIRVGTTGGLDAAEKLVWQWSLKADAGAVTGVREAQAAGVFKGDPLEVRQVLETTARVPVRDGSMLADVLQEWAIRRVQAEMPGYFNNARTVVLSGKNYERTIPVLREFTANIDFVDPALRTDVPIALNTNPVVAKAAEVGMWTCLLYTSRCV